MNTQRLHVVTLAMMIVSMMGGGCASSVVIDMPRKPMTVREAKKAIEGSLNGLHRSPSLSNVKVTQRMLTFTADYKVEGGSIDFKVQFADQRNIAIGSYLGLCRVFADGKPILPPSALSSVGGWFKDEESARTFVDCLLTLRDAAPDTEGADFAGFNAAAKAWLAAESRPPMSDDARTSKAMAEDAFKRKDFAGALAAYLEGLGKHPMWPEGHYNAALLAAECEDFELAATHMRRYLVLAPDAKDASAAKDKFLLWQRKAKQ